MLKRKHHDLTEDDSRKLEVSPKNSDLSKSPRDSPTPSSFSSFSSASPSSTEPAGHKDQSNKCHRLLHDRIFGFLEQHRPILIDSLSEELKSERRKINRRQHKAAKAANEARLQAKRSSGNGNTNGIDGSKTSTSEPTQKSVRDQGTVMKERADVEDGKKLRCVREAQELKFLGSCLSDVAEERLIKSVMRVKGIVNTPGFPAEQLEEQLKWLMKKTERMHNTLQSSNGDGGESRNLERSNVLGRLCKSDAVRTSITMFVDEVQNTVLGSNGSRLGRKQGQRSKREQEDKIQEDIDDWDGIQSDIEMDEEPYQDLASRVNGSSDEESTDLEEDSVNDVRRSKSAFNRSKKAQVNKERSSNRLSEPNKPLSKTKESTSKSRSDSTTFLPSLSFGGYYSGGSDESGLDDYDPGDGNQASRKRQEQQVRKNRMGQQARRALNEKKFGGQANHLRTDNRRNKGKDNRESIGKGASFNGKRVKVNGQISKEIDNQGGYQGRSKLHHGETGSAAQHRPEPRSGGIQQNEEKGLHPSWEAARKAKEAKKMAGFQGKKVVF